jgi:hypothetical protein
MLLNLQEKNNWKGTRMSIKFCGGNDFLTTT